MTPLYHGLVKKAHNDPKTVSSYKESLREYYNNLTAMTPEESLQVAEAQNIAPQLDTITENLHSSPRLSIFKKTDEEFDADRSLEEIRSYTRLRINVKDLTEANPLDRLLIQLAQRIFNLGYGDAENPGTFDIRLEKGIIPLEGNPWKWHIDGDGFRTSITTCFSNKDNWSTRILTDLPAAHGFLYDALQELHRAPIPSDLEDEEFSPHDYRLFIRYNEFRTWSSPQTAVQDSLIPRELPSLKRETPLPPLRSPSSLDGYKPLLAKEPAVPTLEPTFQLPSLRFPTDQFKNSFSRKKIDDLFSRTDQFKVSFSPIKIDDLFSRLDK